MSCSTSTFQGAGSRNTCKFLNHMGDPGERESASFYTLGRQKSERVLALFANATTGVNFNLYFCAIVDFVHGFRDGKFMKKKIIWSLLGVLALIVLVALNSKVTVGEDQSASKVAQAFPVFQLKTAQGREFSDKNFQSKLTLVNFFFDKCAPCIAEVPDLNQFALDHPEIQVIAVTSDSQTKVDQFVKEHRFNWPILFDARKLISNDLGVTTYPTFMLVDETGKILGVRHGAESDGKVNESLSLWIEELRGK